MKKLLPIFLFLIGCASNHPCQCKKADLMHDSGFELMKYGDIRYFDGCNWHTCNEDGCWSTDKKCRKE